MQSKNLFVLLCFISFVNLFFFRSIGFFGLQLFLLGAWIFVCALAFVKNNVQKYLPVYVGTGISLVVSIILGTQRASDLVHFILILNSLFSVSLAVYVLASLHPHLYSLLEVMLSPVLNFFTYLGAGLQQVDKLSKTKPVITPVEKSATHQLENPQWKKIRPIFGGLLLTVPIAFFLISLFSQADPVFGTFVKNLVNHTFLETMLWRAILSFICFCLGFPLLLMERKNPFVSPLNGLDKLSLVIEYSVVMSVVAVIIASFLVVQWQYIFIPSVSGVNLSQFGVATYSEYVNKGFNELLTATVFIFALIWFGLLLIRRKPEHEIRYLKSMQFVVLVEFVVVVLSVFRRIWLYQHYHGMSLIRFYGGYFLIFLLAMTATLFLRHLFNYRFVLIEIGIVAISVFGLALINVEGYIADSHPPTVNERIDYVYLSRMSPDGVSGWKKSYGWTKQVLDAQYPESSTISAEQRREIAYSGITLEQLLSRYQELAIDTGSDEELKGYYQKALEDLSKQNEAAWNHLDALQKPILDQPNNQNLLKKLGEYRQSLTRGKEAIQQASQKLDNNTYDRNPALVETTSPLFYPYSHNSKVDFDPNSCGYWGLCGSFSADEFPNTFYTINIQNNQDQHHSAVMLDRVFRWNSKDRQVFDDIKTTMPLEDLLRLQSKYFALAHRISLQATGDRDYDADISLNTPFLHSISGQDD